MGKKLIVSDSDLATSSILELANYCDYLHLDGPMGEAAVQTIIAEYNSNTYSFFSLPSLPRNAKPTYPECARLYSELMSTHDRVFDEWRRIKSDAPLLDFNLVANARDRFTVTEVSPSESISQP